MIINLCADLWIRVSLQHVCYCAHFAQRNKSIKINKTRSRDNISIRLSCLWNVKKLEQMSQQPFCERIVAFVCVLMLLKCMSEPTGVTVVINAFSADGIVVVL